jgi:hypothetical protein
MKHNATHQFVRGSDSDAEQTTKRRKTTSTASSSTIAHPKPSLPLTAASPSRLGFTSLYSPENPTALDRVDAFYELPPLKRGDAVYLTYQAKPTPQPTETQGDSNLKQSQIPTSMVVPRLMFPARPGNLHAFKWGDIKRRDEAARCIDTILGSLYSQGTLSASVAGADFRTHKRLMNGDGNTLRLQLGSFLRNEKSERPSDDISNPATGPSTNRPSIPSSNHPENVLLEVGGGIFILNIREAAEHTDASEWEKDKIYPDLETQLKPLPSNRRVTVESIPFGHLEKVLQKSIETQSHITKEARCIFGNVVLCGPDAPSTVASTSTAAAS